MEPKKLYGALTVYRERGAYLRRLEQYEKAKVAYDEAFENDQSDLRLLIGRSQVCADAVKPEQAFAAAELALQLDPLNMSARNMQARALYTMSEFERSLTMNYRGSRRRHQPPYFQEGIIQGLETIQDCIGENAGSVMLDFLPIIRQQEKMPDDEFKLRPVKHKCRIPQPENKRKLTQMEARKDMVLSRVLAMKYLGPMAYDKFFLEHLMKDSRLPSANVKGNQELHSLIKEASTSLRERQEMLRAQRPFYSIRFAEKCESKHLTKFKKNQLMLEQEIGAENAERCLRAIDKCCRELNMRELIMKAERFQVFLDGKTPRNLPDKDIYTDRLYRIIGEGYLSQYRLSYKLNEQANCRRVAFLMGLPVGRPTSYDSVRAKYPYKFVDTHKTIEKVIATLDMCENSYMRCWLMYELSHLLNTIKNYALAKYYVKRIQREAEELGSAPWWLNGCFMLISGDMQQMNSNDVRIAVEQASTWVNKLLAPESVQVFMNKCIEIVSQTPTTDEMKVVRQREMQILKVMDDKSRVETGVLFKRMSTVPPGRRFAVLPRKAQAVSLQSERRRRRQRGLTVVPGAERALAPMPKSTVLGFQTFDI